MAELTPAQEARVQAAVQAAYGVWLPQVESAVLAAYNRFGAAPDPNAATSRASVWNAQVAQIESEALYEVAQEQYAAEGGDGKVDMSAALMLAAATATALLLAVATSQVVVFMTGIMLTAPGRDEQAAKIRAYLDPSQPHWKAKAEQLAVSEGNRWAQAASLTAAQKMGKTEKIWVTRDDDKVRMAHASTDGQRRPLGAPFNVAGFPMMHPMDPAAPPSLVINCRCWLRFDRGNRA